MLAIQEKVSRGVTQYDAGIEVLKDIYGYTDELARKILGEPIQQFPEDEETVNEETETNKVEEDESDISNE